ncbi:MAG TPA: NADP-dependent phosphogluconate dehydrogenase [Bacteroidota bacterium]
MSNSSYELGMIGLGVMGRNLLLNMADRGFAVAGYDKDTAKVQSLRKEAEGHNICSADNLNDLIGHLRQPRVVMLLIPAGPPVDAVIHELGPFLNAGDLIIDGGNSYFRDTERRSAELKKKGIGFMGVGISGGEQGARKGPSIMPGGQKESYERVRQIFEAIAARVGGKPCVTYLGPGSAGHYVKMVHNGIEYGAMQLIAESFHLMKQSMGLTNDRLHSIYEQWNFTELGGYLIEITGAILAQKDDRTGKDLVDVILDEARQKGTGLWTSQEAMTLGVPLPTVDLAVMMRQLSDLKEYRVSASQIHDNVGRSFQGDQETFIEQIRNALYAAMLITYSQGMSLLRVASDTYKYNLKLGDIARIWQGGCIIRATLLEKIRIAYEAKPDLRSLLLDSGIVKDIIDRQQQLRAVVQVAVGLAIPVPGISVSLSYMDGYRSPWLPANLIQAQRDYFGAHSYERVDAAGVFHTAWRED